MTNSKNKKSKKNRTTNKHRREEGRGMAGRRGTIVAVVAAAALVVGGSATLGAMFVQAGSETPASPPDDANSASEPAGSSGSASDTDAGPGTESEDPSSADSAAGETPGSQDKAGKSKDTTGDSSSPASASTTAAPDPLEVGLGPSAPKSLSIPAIKVNAKLAKLAMAKDETIELPSSAANPGWYSRSPSPGELGPAIVAGFIRTPKTEGVFANLGKLKKGHEIKVNRADGKVAVFKVDKIKQYPVGKFVASEVYSSPRQPMLRIVTVGGTIKPTDEPGNVVVFSHLVGVEKAGKDSAKSATTTGSR